MITVAGWLFVIMRLSVIGSTAAFRFTGGQIEADWTTTGENDDTESAG